MLQFDPISSFVSQYVVHYPLGVNITVLVQENRPRSFSLLITLFFVSSANVTKKQILVVKYIVGAINQL